MDDQLYIFPTLEEFSHAAAKRITELTQDAIRLRGNCTLALSGGSTPRRLYELLLSDYRDRIDWKHVHFFWTDDRFVPAIDANSNYRLAKETLLDRLGISNENIHPINTAMESPVAAAEDYAATLQSYFAGEITFDIVLLGLGPDGHIASLFPTSKLNGEHGELVTVTEPNVSPFVTRVSVTMPVLNGARHSIFLISGKEKSTIFTKVIESRRDHTLDYPASHLMPKGTVEWYMDKAAFGI